MMLRSTSYAMRRAWPLLNAFLWLPFTIIFTAEVVKEANSMFNPFVGFRPISVSIPNHCTGENPIVHVTRISKERVIGSFLTKIEPAFGSGAGVCPFQSSDFEYRPRSDFFFASDMKSYFWQGQQCRIPPGKWIGEVQWTFKRPWHADTVISIHTFPFEVWPTTDKRCVR